MALEQGHLRIGRSRKTLDPSVGHLAVATPALAVGGYMAGSGARGQGLHQGLVAADTVLLHHTLPRGVHPDDLGLGPEGKNGGMAKTILGFEVVFVQHVIVRHVAIIASGHQVMRTMLPGGKLRRHDVAIDAGGRLVREVGVGLGGVHDVTAQPGKNTSDQNNGGAPGTGRKQQSVKSIKAVHGLRVF